MTTRGLKSPGRLFQDPTTDLQPPSQNSPSPFLPVFSVIAAIGPLDYLDYLDYLDFGLLDSLGSFAFAFLYFLGYPSSLEEGIDP